MELNEIPERKGDWVDEIHLMTKMALTFPSSWLNFRHVSSWLQAPDLHFLKACTLMTCHCKCFPAPIWKVYKLPLARFRTPKISSDFWATPLKCDQCYQSWRKIEHVSLRLCGRSEPNFPRCHVANQVLTTDRSTCKLRNNPEYSCIPWATSPSTASSLELLC